MVNLRETSANAEEEITAWTNQKLNSNVIYTLDVHLYDVEKRDALKNQW